MSTRTRPDLISLSIGPGNVDRLKAVAFQRGIPVSALVRKWVSTLADPTLPDSGKGASDGKS